MNHVYFTARVHGASLAAGLAGGDGRERVYGVEPSGSFEDDPNVTNKKFPGISTRSYRTEAPLKVVGEVTDWARQSPEELRKWREKLSAKRGEIINRCPPRASPGIVEGLGPEREGSASRVGMRRR